MQKCRFWIGSCKLRAHLCPDNCYWHCLIYPIPPDFLALRILSGFHPAALCNIKLDTRHASDRTTSRPFVLPGGKPAYLPITYVNVQSPSPVSHIFSQTVETGS
ncbi:uncharacterized protein LACBIDRAFT_325508 [Laccaria bicolor S238N-H82]|uniref:Predicted protein n=1 Tax=Laccaria bicolor (strain S238N-H82 / ATCC MYA-4686) TaxID=486041 RepID=B0D5B6_LACBS|nr:uncharacterized protein LACBIDRAFT_325508 [Laccaria bicolor S238N-H82]EDR09988.1 predicted protein [Laccaria bicolor S238N-H82]|eukprot:XP_001879373.1 predicted protein [Laccaria bicolor S238N-H82]